MDEITIHVDGGVFHVEKEVLCKYSDYFRAMFNGRYLEGQKKGTSIDMVKPSTMSILLQYMTTGATDLSVHPLCTIADIAAAADYLVMTGLTKRIVQTLYWMDLCESNCMQLLAIAESGSFKNVEQLYAAFAVYSFRSMSPEHIPTIHKLAWYLSHPHLDCQRELDVFNFGFQWVLNNRADADALLIVLACLDYAGLAHEDIQEIQNCVKQQEFVSSLAAAVVDCLFEMSDNNREISEPVITEQRNELCDKFAERVWAETKAVVSASSSRLLNYTLVVPMCKRTPTFYEYVFHSLSPEGFKKWLTLDVVEWTAVSWGLTKLVILYIDYLLEYNLHLRKVTVYDSLRKEWTLHDVNIPPAYEGSVLAVVGDCLWILGGSTYEEGKVRWKNMVIVYDLKQKTYSVVAELPEPSLPHACAHNDKLYVALKNYIYCYEDTATVGTWRAVLPADDGVITGISSHKGYIYCIQQDSAHLYRFRPDLDVELEVVTSFSLYPFKIMSIGNKLLALTGDYIHAIRLVEHFEIENSKRYRKAVKTRYTKVMYRMKRPFLSTGETARSCALVTTPPLCNKLSDYHIKLLLPWSS